MRIDLDEKVEREDLALLQSAQRLAIIAEILAAGLRRRRQDSRRMGEYAPFREREAAELESSGQARLDRPAP